MNRPYTLKTLVRYTLARGVTPEVNGQKRGRALLKFVHEALAAQKGVRTGCSCYTCEERRAG